MERFAKRGYKLSVPTFFIYYHMHFVTCVFENGIESRLIQNLLLILSKKTRKGKSACLTTTAESSEIRRCSKISKICRTRRAVRIQEISVVRNRWSVNISFKCASSRDVRGHSIQDYRR